LVDTAPASVSEDVAQQVSSVIMGYGIETTFTLQSDAYQAVTGAISSAKSSGGSISIFGSLYGSSGKSLICPRHIPTVRLPNPQYIL
jgi:hypothetical protein